MSSPPLVSVVLPVRNGERYLKAAVDSMLGQTFGDFELLALDDGSTDDTQRILAACATSDPRVQVFRASPRGLVATLNDGFRRSRGKYIARIDADDIAFPGRLEAQVSALEMDPELAVIGAAVVVVTADLRPQYTVRYPPGDRAIRAALPHGSQFAHPVVTLRKSAFERAGGYRSAFLHAEDYDLWLRLAEVGRLANLRQPLLYYRAHPSQVSFAGARQQVISVVAAQFAAGARASGTPEPFAAGRQITMEDLLSAPHSGPTSLASQLAAAATNAATQMTLMHEADQALDLMDWARLLEPSGKIASRTRARSSLARAAAYWSKRKRWQSLRAGLRACGADPLVTADTAWTAARAFASARGAW